MNNPDGYHATYRLIWLDLELACQGLRFRGKMNQLFTCTGVLLGDPMHAPGVDNICQPVLLMLTPERVIRPRVSGEAYKRILIWVDYSRLRRSNT